MTGKDYRNVNETIETEGFEYTFISYSHFEDVADEKFHELRKRYIQAREELAEYVGFEG